MGFLIAIYIKFEYHLRSECNKNILLHFEENSSPVTVKVSVYTLMWSNYSQEKFVFLEMLIFCLNQYINRLAWYSTLKYQWRDSPSENMLHAKSFQYFLSKRLIYCRGNDSLYWDVYFLLHDTLLVLPWS